MKTYTSREAMEAELERLPRTVFVEVSTGLLASLMGREFIELREEDMPAMSISEVNLHYDVDKEQVVAVPTVRSRDANSA